MPAATVAQVVAVNTGDDHVFEFERRDGFGQVQWLIRIQWVWPAVAHVAKRAAAGALVAHDHEGRGALAKAFANVRATGFFTHGVELVLAQDLLDLVKAGGG